MCRTHTKTHQDKLTAGELFKALNYVGEFKRRHPEVKITRPSEGRSGMWEVEFSRTDRASFSQVETMARELRQWEGLPPI